VRVAAPRCRRGIAAASELSLEIDTSIVSELNAEHEMEMEVHLDTELEVASMCSTWDLVCKGKEAAAAAKAKADQIAAAAKAAADKAIADAKAAADKAAAAAKAAADKAIADAKAAFKKLEDKVPQWTAAAKNGFVKGADGFASWTAEQVEYMLKDPNAPAAFTSPVLPGDLMPTGADADLMMAQLSSLVYSSNAAAGASLSFSYKGKCSTVVVKAAFMRNNQRSWVVYLPDMAAVAIVFRGTTLGQGVATAIDNVVSDLSIVFSDCNFNKVNCGRVSKGFLDLYQAVRTNMMAAVVSTVKANKIVQMYITGHSLGAAVATIAGFDYASYFAPRSDPTMNVNRIHMSLFGSPRVGNPAFVNAIRSYMKTSQYMFMSAVRYFNTKSSNGVTRKDPITELAPSWFGFYHIIDATGLDCPSCAFSDVMAYHSVATYALNIQALQKKAMTTCASTQPALVWK